LPGTQLPYTQLTKTIVVLLMHLAFLKIYIQSTIDSALWSGEFKFGGLLAAGDDYHSQTKLLNPVKCSSFRQSAASNGAG
jgi:hypothetical protein